jgi:hypothetical protein
MNMQTVVVKDIANRPQFKIVCHASKDMVFVTSEPAFIAMQKGEKSVFPIGFPRDRVFVYDGRELSGKINWAEMKRWQGDGKGLTL